MVLHRVTLVAIKKIVASYLCKTAEFTVIAVEKASVHRSEATEPYDRWPVYWPLLTSTPALVGDASGRDRQVDVL